MFYIVEKIRESSTTLMNKLKGNSDVQWVKLGHEIITELLLLEPEQFSVIEPQLDLQESN